MRLRTKPTLITALGITGASLALFTATAFAGSGQSYTAGTPALTEVQNGPWTLSQGDPAAGAPYNKSLPTYTPGGTPTQTGGYPNLAVYPNANAPSSTPYASGVAGTPGPVDAYCGTGAAPESGTQGSQPANTPEPMSPYYFPFVMQTPGDSTQGHLTGFFDYRPKDTEEAVVATRSTDGGQTWKYVGKAFEQNPENYCPTGDTNDNGTGHAFVMAVGGVTRLYRLNRPSGDNVGVNLLADAIDPGATNPLDPSVVPAVQSVGTDPDTFANGATSVPATGGTTLPVTTLGTGAETVGAGQFEDVDASNPPGSVITCSASAGSALTGCTTANPSGLAVAGGDALVQVMADVSVAVTIPQGPNSPLENGGASLSLNTALSTNTANNVPGRFYVDGATVYCVNINSANTQLQNCTTTQSGGVAVATGAALTTDPILPSGTGKPGKTQQTAGLVAPDGIVDTLPSSISYPGAPSGATVIIYGEKILNYYIEGTVASAVTLPASTITMTRSTSPTAPIPGSGSFNIYLGTSGGIQSVTCTGFSSGSTDTLSGCSGGTGSVAAGNDVGGPGAAIASSATLAAIGEGSTKPKTLFKNNEDYTALRAAYTTDGLNFTDIGAISGSDPSHTTDVNNPGGQAYPSSINLAPGSVDNPELRYVGTRGTIIENSDGTVGMFLSGAWQSDGDSDAFDQIFYTTSTDGLHWTPPVVVLSTDYTFSARQQQDAALAGGHDDALDISGYYAGRVYGPTVVQNPDGSLTMLFAGYSTPKPVPVDGSLLGDQQGGAPQWTVGTSDPALYRNILTVTLTATPGTALPESPAVVALPLLALLLLGGALLASNRRRRRIAVG
jgi:hypothetical protein